MTIETLSTSVAHPFVSKDTPSPPIAHEGTTGALSSSSAGLWSTSGRIGRIQYFNRTAVPGLVVNGIILAISFTNIDIYSPSAFTTALFLLVTQLILTVSFTIYAVIQAKRRLNDLNKSGWLILLFLIPLISLIPFIMVTFIKGTDGDNRYGRIPPATGPRDFRLFFASLGLLIIVSAILVSLAI
ncbi:MAG: DUF805 domain-containing protein [Gammaproteobacteria bacterium]|uniref:DUF805 domain-containing protein n=1 Tax=Halomonas sp. EF61 TaxID=2950869 RepID=UPI0032DFBB55|nr:DUF805 domain-containing protein [Gammaproteobacteria bacterium]